MTKIPERFPCAVSWIKFPLIVFAFPVIKLKNQLFAELCWAGQGTCCFFYLCSWWKCIKPGSFLSNFTPPQPWPISVGFYVGWLFGLGKQEGAQQKQWWKKASDNENIGSVLDHFQTFFHRVSVKPSSCKEGFVFYS